MSSWGAGKRDAPMMVAVEWAVGATGSTPLSPALPGGCVYHCITVPLHVGFGFRIRIIINWTT